MKENNTENFVDAIEKVYLSKEKKPSKEEAFFRKFNSDEKLANLSIEQLEAILAYYEARRNRWDGKFLPVITTFSIILAGVIGAIFSSISESIAPFVTVMLLLVVLGIFYGFNLCSHKEKDICCYLAYIIARKK